jgi:GNAT superfamily N-acetyltransferase
MNILVSPVDPKRIVPFRDLYCQELNCQIVHDTAHGRKDCTESFLVEVNGEIAGYGATWIGPYWMSKGALFEFYVLSTHRSDLFTIFDEFVRFIKPPKIHTQTNDPFLGLLFYDHVQKVIPGHILFNDGKTTNHAIKGVTFRHSAPEDKDHIFKHHVEPIGDWVLETEGKIVATGGVLYHYNRPYGDIFMEVDEPFRRRGLGRFLVQELKRVCYKSGSTPAARCLPSNFASRRTLEGAGFAPCGRLISGDTVHAPSSATTPHRKR